MLETVQARIPSALPLAAPHTPTLFVWSREDAIVPLECGNSTTSLSPAAAAEANQTVTENNYGRTIIPSPARQRVRAIACTNHVLCVLAHRFSQRNRYILSSKTARFSTMKPACLSCFHYQQGEIRVLMKMAVCFWGDSPREQAEESTIEPHSRFYKMDI
jgi:hypothetical protein